MDNSKICIGLVNKQDNLQGFARVLTDFTFKALIFDVIVSSNCRGIGMGNILLKAIKSNNALRTVKHFELYCLPELETFYRRHGFFDNFGEIKLMRLG